jgi:hypothetical protein
MNLLLEKVQFKCQIIVHSIQQKGSFTQNIIEDILLIILLSV